MKLENWGIVSVTNSPYQAPEMGAKCLSGNVYDNPRFEDGESITTSAIANVALAGDEILVTTKSGSVYQLGAVHPDYEAEYPGARGRLITAASQGGF